MINSCKGITLINSKCQQAFKGFFPYEPGQSGSVSEISPRHSFLYKNFDMFIWEAGLTRSLQTEDENFPIWTLQPGWPGRTFLKIASLSQHSGQGEYEVALSVKLQDATKIRQPWTIQVPPLWFCFLNFILVDRAGISHDLKISLKSAAVSTVVSRSFCDIYLI